MKILLLGNLGFALPFINQDSDISIHSYKQYNDFWSNSALAKFDSIIIQAETKWDNFYYTDFRGLALIQDLRVNKNCWLPIIITSLIPEILPKNKLFPTTLSFSPVRLDPAIKFIEIDRLYKMSKSDLPFDELVTDNALKEDLKLMVYNPEHYISESLHKLSSDIKRIAEKKPIDKEEIFAVLESVFNILTDAYPKHKPFLKDVTLAIHKLINDEVFINSETLQSIIDSHFLRVEEKLFADTKPKKSLEIIKVLYIDDEKQDRIKLEKQLEEYRIKCITVADVNTAINTLKKEPEIYVVICDYRFYDSGGRIARKQGYHIIKEIRKTIRRHLYCIALTSMNKAYQADFLDKHRDIVYGKKDVRESPPEFKEFLRMLIEKHYQAKKEISSKPPDFSQKYWQFYFAHKEDWEDFQKAEKKISDYALAFINGVKNEYKLENLAILSGVTTNLDKKTIKGGMETFRHILTARRTIIGLLQFPNEYFGEKIKKSIKRKIVYNLVRHKEFEKNIVDDSYGNFWSTKIYLKRGGIDYQLDDKKDLPLTLEERNWLSENASLFS